MTAFFSKQPWGVPCAIGCLPMGACPRGSWPPSPSHANFLAPYGCLRPSLATPTQNVVREKLLTISSPLPSGKCGAPVFLSLAIPDLSLLLLLFVCFCNVFVGIPCLYVWCSRAFFLLPFPFRMAAARGCCETLSTSRNSGILMHPNCRFKPRCPVPLFPAARLSCTYWRCPWLYRP